MVILIDNGHGSQVLGKQSPILDDSIKIGGEFTEKGRFKEWKYTRVISHLIVNKLIDMGYDARLVTPEKNDVSLAERIRRINTICNKEGASNVLLISVHANAVGDSTKWMEGKGWEAYTTRGKTISDTLADFLYKRADSNIKGRKIREDWTDGDRDKEADFYIIKKAKCAAVLTENFFYDNKDDLRYLTSDEGVHAVVRLHIEGIIDFIYYKEGK
jgi:N-acetylmuramoyl-L-alanine amidase